MLFSISFLFSIFCNIGNFLSFSHLITHPIHEWSWFYRQFQFCSIISHDEILRICHFLRTDIRSPWSITKCFSVPYGLRGSVEKNFLVIRSNFSYHSPRSFIRSLRSFVCLNLSFPLLRRPSTVIIQLWIICWREALHELLMEVMNQRLKTNLFLYQVALIYLLQQLISMDLDFRNVSSPSSLKLKTIRTTASW